MDRSKSSISLPDLAESSWWENEFQAQNSDNRMLTFYKHVKANEKVLLTSSFGTTSAILLHHLYRLGINQEITFLDTSFHFRETLAYKQDLEQKFGFAVRVIGPEPWKNEYIRQDETWKKDPDFCCSVNKVEPLQLARQHADYWISGLMGWQNSFRNNLGFLQYKHEILKFHPFIDWTAEEARTYMRNHQIPLHPLAAKGYASVGCTHCTVRGTDRSGRWGGWAKTECGIHR